MGLCTCSFIMLYRVSGLTCPFCIVWYASIHDGFYSLTARSQLTLTAVSQMCFTSALRAFLISRWSGSWQRSLTPRCLQRTMSCSLPHQRRDSIPIKLEALCHFQRSEMISVEPSGWCFTEQSEAYKHKCPHSFWVD